MSIDPATSPVPTGTRALSPSKIETLQCPHRYRQLYVLGQEPPALEAVELAVGTLIHEVAAMYVSHLRDRKRQTDHAALQAYADAAWEHRPHRIPEQHRADFFGFVGVLEQQVFEPETILEAEHRVTFAEDWTTIAWGDQLAAWGGMVDVVGVRGAGEDAEIYAIDWTTAAISGAFGVKKNLQLRMYAMLLGREYGIERVTISARSLRTGAEQTMTLDAADHAETFERLTRERERLAELLDLDPRFPWPAVPNSQCGICLLKCPIYEESLKGDLPLRLENREDAASALQQVVLLDAKRKGLMAILKAYAAFHGPVESGGMEAASRPIEKRDYPTARVAELLRAGGIDPYLVLKLDRKALTSQTKKDKDLRADVEALAKITIGERFGVKALKLEEEGDES